MNENELATELLPIALRVARRLWNDPEAESLAGEACIKAMRSFDGRGNIEGHVARCTRIAVFHTWRKVKVRSIVKLEASEYLECHASFDDEINDSPLTQEEWQILCEKYELGWPFDVVAKRHNTSTRYMKQLIPWLIWKLQQAL